MRITLPNILTLFRLLAAPGVIFAFLVLPRPFADWVAFTLFVLASVTDYVDGYLARRLEQISRIGTMLDPIADKAMVMIALLALGVWSPLAHWIALPAGIILFREVFVSGLREFLGNVAGTLKVTKLAKWKTAVQMVAVALLLAQGAFNANLGMSVFGMDGETVSAILSGEEEDPLDIRGKMVRAEWGGIVGVGLLWIAAGLTAVTGWDYFQKARAHLGEE
jgi:CDP-diacylglycerol--glycerol-3-phosphate 3-phosphatidyltransferase